MRPNRFIFTATVAAIAAAALAAPTIANELEPGTDAPEFTLTDHAGNEVSLSDFDGTVRVLEWMNPDCPFVQRHYTAGTMTTLATEYADKNVVWLAINTTHYFTQAKNAEFAKEHKLPYPVLNDSDGTVGKQYGAATTPQMVIIDTNGTVVYNGAIDDDPRGRNEGEATNYVRNALNQLLAGESIEPASTKPYGCSVKYAKK